MRFDTPVYLRGMKVEIWSDVMCPFCYIGKRRFEKAMELSGKGDQIEVTWKSFQLSPEIKTNPSKNIHQFLAEHKGMSVEKAKALNDQVSQLAAKDGLVYNFDKSVVANTFNAHRFAHFAKAHGKQSEAEEMLFRSYFTDGRNLDDIPTLSQIGEQIGLDPMAVKDALTNDEYSNDVKIDIQEAQELGIRGVPFFVFDRKYAVSGAQETGTFLQAIENASKESEQGYH
jgi:predicted DsbA family dithiol-disulfide isomerase